MPPLLILNSEVDYRQRFEASYCRGVISTYDGIRVYFIKSDFDHAFFESSLRNGVKDTALSSARAERMEWIAATLAEPTAVRYQGWDKKNGRYDPTRCVSVVYGDFVVVISCRKKADGSLKAKFVTCYDATNSIRKIRLSPLWTMQDCLNAL